ncbi:hypothetical protein DSY14_23075 [Nocardiopsis sp. MG754419]|nr:hypothetical protein [Nocardiopsis sp. MG754419]
MLRGFDRGQVAEAVQRALHTLSCPDEATITAARLRSLKFDVVLRGLDRTQVADHLDLLADRLDGVESHTNS